jgi:hypothetical protein
MLLNNRNTWAPPDPGEVAGALAISGPAAAETPDVPTGPFVALPLTVLHARISAQAKILYCYLRHYARSSARCWPGTERLQADLDWSVNTVTKYLRELEAAGYLTIHRRGHHHHNTYTLHDQPALEPQILRLKTDDAADEPQNLRLKPPPAPTLEPQNLRLNGPGDALEPQNLRLKEPSTSNFEDESAVAAAVTKEQQQPLREDHQAARAAAAALVAYGIAPEVAHELAAEAGPAEIRRQLEWILYRNAATNPGGLLVEAIRKRWPAPPAWRKEHERQERERLRAEASARKEAEEAAAREAERRRLAALTPEQRVAGPLQAWIAVERTVRKREPTPEQIAAHQAALIANLPPP